MEHFGQTSSGESATLYTLVNRNGLVAKVTNFGATLVEMHVPDRDGVKADVVLGFDDVSGYEGDTNQYFGCTAGRVANRVAGGRFELDGASYQLATNNAPNHLHGGDKGFGQRLWAAEALPGAGDSGVTFSYLSPAGEEGYPGAVDIKVSYLLTDSDELHVRYEATADAATPLNPTNHSYFNLAGHGAPTVLDHLLVIEADQYTPTDETLIPTGLYAPVAGTPLDFTSEARIGDRIASLDDTAAIGYDHNYVLRGGRGIACRLSDPGSGRVLEIRTDEPGVQFYSGNFLNGQAGKGGKVYAHRSALCLETQHFPDSINHPDFPSTVLRPGEVYSQHTIHRFYVD